MITLADIQTARERIGAAIFASPCAFSQTFSSETGNHAYFKLENLQMTGSFKERGALNKILSLTEAERTRGVICASAGNHAQAVAYHATRLGASATIVMPVLAPLTKVNATRRYGGTVILHGNSYDEAFAEAQRLGQERQLTYIHAFNDDAVIAGQGTIGLEILNQVPDVEAIVAPIGGGGLIGGIAVAVKAVKPDVRIVGVQTARIPSMQAALREHAPVTVPPSATIADGIGVRRVGDRNLEIAGQFLDEYVTVEEEEIAGAILWLLEREKTVAEGAGATATAALLERRTSLQNKVVVSLVCGGNIDSIFLTRIIERGLVKDGRLVRIRIRTTDHPGALHAVTGIFARLRANVIEISHERAYFNVRLGYTAIDLTLETRGADHADEILAALDAAGYPHERIT